MRNFIKGLVGGLAMMLTLSTASAEELTIMDLDETTRVVVFWGEVIPGSAARLNDLLVANPDVKRIAMASPGGNAVEGFLIADVLSNHEMTAMVPPGFACLSACAVGFIGAAEYLVHGALGFHNMYIGAEEIDLLPSLSLLIMGQSFGVHTAVFFLANGFEVELPLLIGNHTSPDVFLVFTSTEDLMQFFARSDTDKINEYLEPNNIDQQWLDDHLWGPLEMIEYLGADLP